MKKLVALVLAICVLGASHSLADTASRYDRLIEKARERYGIDFSAYTYDDLDYLRCLITSIMWDKGSKTVTVPEGLYVIGTEIPADTWMIYVTAGNEASVGYGPSLMGGGRAIQPFNIDAVVVTLDSDTPTTRIRMEEGYYFQVVGDPVCFYRYPQSQPTFEW